MMISWMIIKSVFVIRDIEMKRSEDLWLAITSGKLNNVKLSPQQRMELITQVMSSSRTYTLAPFLPALLSLDKHPYTLENHFPFEVIFQTHMPRKLIMKTGRQVSKCVYKGHNSVYLRNGRRVKGQDLKIGDEVLTMNNKFEITSSVVTDIVAAPKKPILRIVT